MKRTCGNPQFSQTKVAAPLSAVPVSSHPARGNPARGRNFSSMANWQYKASSAQINKAVGASLWGLHLCPDPASAERSGEWERQREWRVTSGEQTKSRSLTAFGMTESRQANRAEAAAREKSAGLKPGLYKGA